MSVMTPPPLPPTPTSRSPTWGSPPLAQGDTLAEHEMPGLMAIRREFATEQPLKGADHGLAAHDDPDGRFDRDADGARRRGALVQLQHLLNSGSRRGGGGSRSEGTPEDPQGIPVFAWKGETLEEYWWCTEQALLGWDPATQRAART